MADEYTHVGIKKPTQRKVAVLAKVLDTPIYSLVEYWAKLEWQAALKAGLVTEAMLTHGAEPTTATEAVAVETPAAPRRRQRIGRDF